MSRHGLFLQVEEPPAIRQLIRLTVHLPDGPLTLMATVMRHVLPPDPSVVRLGKGAGCQFFALARNDKDRWDRFILARKRGEVPVVVAPPPASVSPGDAPTNPAGPAALGAEQGAPASTPEEAAEELPYDAHPTSRLATLFVNPDDGRELRQLYERAVTEGLLLVPVPEPEPVGTPILLILVHPDTAAELELGGVVESHAPGAIPGMQVRLELPPARREAFGGFAPWVPGTASFPLARQEPEDGALAPEWSEPAEEPLPPRDDYEVMLETTAPAGPVLLDAQLSEAAIAPPREAEAPGVEARDAPPEPDAPAWTVPAELRFDVDHLGGAAPEGPPAESFYSTRPSPTHFELPAADGGDGLDLVDAPFGLAPAVVAAPRPPAAAAPIALVPVDSAPPRPPAPIALVPVDSAPPRPPAPLALVLADSAPPRPPAPIALVSAAPPAEPLRPLPAVVRERPAQHAPGAIPVIAYGRPAHPAPPPQPSQPEQPDQAQPQPPAERRCPVCARVALPTAAFCGSCGTRITAPVVASAPPAPAPRGKLVAILRDGSEGAVFALTGEEVVAGRSEGALRFADDPFLAPGHVRFTFNGPTLQVADLGTQNGTFRIVRGEALVYPGDELRAGRQLLRLERAPPAEGHGTDGTRRQGSVLPPSELRLTQLLGGGASGRSHLLLEGRNVIGREGGNIVFREDGYLSGKHLELEVRGGEVVVRDLKSSNGTFLRITEPLALGSGDYLLFGEQLLRVELAEER